MFDRETAAKYFVVAWVKNWRMQTYLSAIGAFNVVQFEELHDLYPWLPTQKDLHFYLKNREIRQWVSRSMKVISDKMWDTEDNVKRLALAKRIELWNSDSTKHTTQERLDMQERRISMRKNMQSGKEHTVSMSIMRKGYGTDWKVCK